MKMKIFISKKLFIFQVVLILLGIIFYNIYYKLNTEDINNINWNFFNVSKEKAETEEQKYLYIEEDVKSDKINEITEINKIVIVGIDFGTINSGYSFIYGKDISKINFNKKFPTVFGLSKRNQKGMHYSFTSSISMMNYGKKELGKIIYIKGIKLILNSLNNTVNDNLCYIYPKEVINKLNILNDIKEYFIMLKNDIIKEIAEKYTNIENEVNNLGKIIWIISVPSSWNEFQKQIIKNVLIESGIINNRIIYDSEATSLYIYHNKNIPNKFKKKYFMLIDIGGYSVEITVKEILKEKGYIKEMLETTNFSFGISFLSEEIIKIIENIFGKNNIEQIKNDEPKNWIEILSDINKAIESTYYINGIEIMKIDFPYNKNKFKNKNAYIYDNKTYIIEYNDYSIFFPANLIGKIILNNINVLKYKIEEIIKKLKSKKIKLDSIIFTGGFSQNKILRNEIENYFYKNKKIPIEFLASYQTVISTGSVIYGINPDQIHSRISKINIGIKNKQKNNKIEIIIKKGEEIKNPLKIIKYIRPTLENQKIIQLNVYISDEDIPNDNILKYKFFGRLLLKMNERNKGIIKLIIQYDTCLNFWAINYKNGLEIETEFQFFKY